MISLGFIVFQLYLDSSVDPSGAILLIGHVLKSTNSLLNFLIEKRNRIGFDYVLRPLEASSEVLGGPRRS